jgi:hypothetical protein
MLGSVGVWLALARNKRDLTTLVALLVFVAAATLVWNVIP